MQSPNCGDEAPLLELEKMIGFGEPRVNMQSPNCGDEAPLLELEKMIGFGGDVKAGLKVHPDKERHYIIYSVGCTVVIEDLTSHTQEFFNGHTNNVSCIAVSKSGKYVASGQITHPGFKADMYLWDFYGRYALHQFQRMHHNTVEALAISPNDKYLVSLGGQDDGCVVVWNIATGDPICGSPAQTMSAGCTNTIAFFNQSDDKFVTGGSNTLRVWELDVQTRKVKPTEVNVGQMKRNINCVEVACDDLSFYCGTTSGDIMMVNTISNNFQKHGPVKERFKGGVTSLCLLKNGEFLVGSGSGDIQVLSAKFTPTAKKQHVDGAVTSLALRGSGHQFYVGTSKCNIYCMDFSSFSSKLLTTCHHDIVNDIVFPHGDSRIVLTCSKDDIRIWNTEECKELLRIVQPNMTCNAIAIMQDGKSIISGWDDGQIRAFSPETGHLMYSMEHAYGGSTTALATTKDSQHIVSGSNIGHVVVWKAPNSSSLTNVKNGSAISVKKHDLLKEHKAKVTCIKINAKGTECVTSSIDGSCIIWDLVNLKRKNMIRVNSLFQYTCYGPGDIQIVTTGTDRKIGYWEIQDGSLIREVEGSISGSVNCMDIIDGPNLVSGGDDKLIKVWDYFQGNTMYIGKGHSAPVTGVKIAPCPPGESPRFIISVSKDGAILKWKLPQS